MTLRIRKSFLRRNRLPWARDVAKTVAYGNGDYRCRLRLEVCKDNDRIVIFVAMQCLSSIRHASFTNRHLPQKTAEERRANQV